MSGYGRKKTRPDTEGAGRVGSLRSQQIQLVTHLGWHRTPRSCGRFEGLREQLPTSTEGPDDALA